MIFFNVSATIPNSVLYKHLVNNLNLKFASPVTILCADPKDEEFAHIISSRRQVYITNFEEVYKMGDLTLTHNDYEHHIFVNYDEGTCFIYQSIDHKSAGNGSSS